MRAALLAERALAVPALIGGTDRAHALWMNARLLVARTQYAEAGDLLEEALRLARETEQPRIEADVLMEYADLRRGLAQRDQMHASYRAAAACARACGDSGREALALGEMGLHLQDEGRTDEAEACFREGFAALRDHPDPFREGRLTMNLARIETHRGNLAEGERLLERAQALAHSVGDLTTEARNLLTLGQIAFVQGRFAQALDNGTRSLELSRSLGQDVSDVGTLANLALCLAELGRLDEAQERAAAAMEIAERGGDLFAIARAQMRSSINYPLGSGRHSIRITVSVQTSLKRPLAYENHSA